MIKDSKDPFLFLDDYPKWPSKVKTTDEDTCNGAIPIFCVVDGVSKPFYTIGQLSKALNRKPGTIRSWEATGIIPKAVYRTTAPDTSSFFGEKSKGKRLYTQEQVEFLITCFDKFALNHSYFRRYGGNWDKAKQYIKNNYPK